MGEKGAERNLADLRWSAEVEFSDFDFISQHVEALTKGAALHASGAERVVEGVDVRLHPYGEVVGLMGGHTSRSGRRRSRPFMTGSGYLTGT